MKKDFPLLFLGLATLLLLLFCVITGGEPGDEPESGSEPEAAAPAKPAKPEPEPEPAPFVAVVEDSAPVSGDWFSDAVFIGDSTSVMLESYNAGEGALGRAQFLCAVGLSQNNARIYSAGNDKLPEYPKGSGRHPKLEDAVAQTGAKKVYIMLGINCLAGGVDRARDDLITLAEGIRQKSPGIALFIESVTPMTPKSPRADKTLNNDVIRAFNEAMAETCQEKGWYFINVAEAVTDENGYLRDDLSGDKAMGIHFNFTGTAVWAEYLLRHVPSELKPLPSTQKQQEG